MPILPAEPDLCPSDLWNGTPLELPLDPGDLESPRWWCLHTKPRQEKSTARYLRSNNLRYYLPQVSQESRTPKGRKIKSIVPLFTSYVFLHGTPKDRVESLRGNTLVHVLEIVDQRRIDTELRQIHRVLSSGIPVIPLPHYPVGAMVRIIEGPLTGITGVIERRENGDRFAAVVDFLSQGAAIELHDWQVEPVQESEDRHVREISAPQRR